MHSNHLQAYIVGGFDEYVAGLFLEKGWRGTRELTNADLVIFTGGEDINPELYHEVPLKGIAFNNVRDESEKKVFLAARNFGIPMVGICRGAQLLNVLNGGRLFQHVDCHTRGHYITDIITNQITLVTSTHHQQMRPPQHGILVARGGATNDLSSLCTVKLADGLELTGAELGVDPEVVWFSDTKTLCFQPHPEYPGAESTKAYFWSLVDRYLMPVITEGMVA